MPTYSAANVVAYPVELGFQSQVAPVQTASDATPFPSADRTAPVILAGSPAPGSTLASKSTALAVSVTDDSPLKRVMIFATFSDGTPAEMVHDGTSFRTKYSASVRTTYSDGYGFSVVRTGGWRSNPTLNVYALDDASAADSIRNETNFTAFSWVFAADAAGPVISANAPAAGSTLASATSVAVDVVDAGSLARVIITAAFSDGSPGELVWDGSAAGTGYTVGTAGIANGTRYTIARTAGWRSDPTLYLYGRDGDGNETLWTNVQYLHTPTPPDSSAPTLLSVSPAVASELPSDATPLVLRVLDVSGVSRVLVFVGFGGGEYEVAYDGTAFAPAYDGASAASAISGGVEFELVRDDGWLEDPTVKVYALDPGANELLLGELSYGFTPPPPPPPVPVDSDTPLVANVSPPSGTAIRRAQAISFEVTDANLLLTVVVARFPDGSWEVIHDGAQFAPMYANAATSKVAIAGGYRYTVLRNGGWSRPPTFAVRAVDSYGNMLGD